MKKSALVLGITLAMLATPLQALAGETTHSTLKGGFAIAVWGTYGVTPDFGVVEYFEYYDYLIIIKQTANRDAQGNITGYTEHAADANGSPYGTFTIDRNLGTASISMTDVPASQCEYDANHEFIACLDGGVTMDANVTWTGTGEVIRTHTVWHEQVQADGFKSIFNAHGTGTDRLASAAGTINGTVFSPADLTRGTMALWKSGTSSMWICKGENC
jgi:hypothetical protein